MHVNSVSTVLGRMPPIDSSIKDPYNFIKTFKNSKIWITNRNPLCSIQIMKVFHSFSGNKVTDTVIGGLSLAKRQI